MHYVSGPGVKFSQRGCTGIEFVSNSVCCATFRSHMLRHMLRHLQQNGDESKLETGECRFKKKTKHKNKKSPANPNACLSQQQYKNKKEGLFVSAADLAGHDSSAFNVHY